MSLDTANSNINRNLTIAGTSIAIFTFLLFFLYPRYLSGEINSILFQFTLAVIVSVIFTLVISALYFYGTTVRLTPPSERIKTIVGKAEAFHLIGNTLMLLVPSLILFTINIVAVAVYSLLLWFLYLMLTWLEFRKLAKK